MNISLTTEIENFIHSKVETGRFQNASEVVRTAIRTMMEVEDENQQKLQLLRDRLDRAWEDKSRISSTELKRRLKERREG